VIRTAAIRTLRSLPYLKGRDRLADGLTRRLPERPVKVFGGVTMELDPSEWVQQEIYLYGATEPRTLDLIRRILPPGGMFVDVGAHVGQHALVAAAAVGATGAVLAIDPQPANVDRIGRNARLNNFAWLTAVCAAVSDEDGFVDLPFQDQGDRARLSLADASPNDLPQLFRVMKTRLDTLLAAEPRLPDLLKIDVEGHEARVLAGATRTLAGTGHVIIEQLEAASDEPLRQLASAGFTLFDVAGAPWQPGAPLIERNVWARRGSA
jgi:FkbM family methyltransferase